LLENRSNQITINPASFGTGWLVPSVFWFVGGNDPDEYAKARTNDKSQASLHHNRPKNSKPPAAELSGAGHGKREGQT
jgi:hypothetical protein